MVSPRGRARPGQREAPARPAAGRRTNHWLRAGAAAFAAAGVIGFTLLATGVANAVDAPEPRVVQGNVTSCEDAGLDGDIILQGDEGSETSDAGTGTVTGKNAEGQAVNNVVVWEKQ